jgi:GTP-binding protein
LKITLAEYLKSAVNKEDYPQKVLPQIAFAGRSNVGKSSLINSLVCRKNLAKTSSTPGKTRTINFFIINNEFYIVDLPGYGYAKASEIMRQQWKNMITEYFQSSNSINLSFLLLDSRRDISPLDFQMIEWFNFFKLKTIYIITKIDKLKSSELKKQLRLFIDKLKPIDNNMIIPFSAKTNEGKEDILKLIEKNI